jgi:hypothetical protein
MSALFVSRNSISPELKPSIQAGRTTQRNTTEFDLYGADALQRVVCMSFVSLAESRKIRGLHAVKVQPVSFELGFQRSMVPTACSSYRAVSQS